MILRISFLQLWLCIPILQLWFSLIIFVVTVGYFISNTDYASTGMIYGIPISCLIFSTWRKAKDFGKEEVGYGLIFRIIVSVAFANVALGYDPLESMHQPWKAFIIIAWMSPSIALFFAKALSPREVA